jgi:hypothetical protein
MGGVDQTHLLPLIDVADDHGEVPAVRAPRQRLLERELADGTA